MDLSEAREVAGGWYGTGEHPEELITTLADGLGAIEQLCDKGMASGTPWWVFRDAVREILHPKD